MDTRHRQFLEILDHPPEHIGFEFFQAVGEQLLEITIIVEPEGAPQLKVTLPKLIVGRA